MMLSGGSTSAIASMRALRTSKVVSALANSRPTYQLERFSDSLGSDWARDERRERRGEVRRERVVDTAVECLQRFSPAECRNCFRHCGYSIATQS